jgi:hypothetical protein
MNRPITMLGTPAMTFDRKRTTEAIGLEPPYSCRYTAARIPRGTASSVAKPVMTRVPAMAGPMPPRARRTWAGSSPVRKPRSMTPRPLDTT